MVRKVKRTVKGKQGKGAKSGLSFPDLPTELIEDICERLKAQNRKRSLAILNVANKRLRNITSPYLWETVKWTPKTWNAEVLCTGKIPEVFRHIRHIMLLSSEVNAKFNGWGDYDSKFWEPLLTQPLPQLKNQNFGQIVHAFFPNIKYVTCLNVPPPRRIPTVKTTLTTLTTYVSDQNLIQPQDTTAFRKMIFDMLGEYRHGKNVPRKFTDLDKAPKFRADRLNIPDFSTTLHVVKEALSIEHHLVVSEKRRRQVEPTFRIIGAFDPFRNVLTLTVDDIRLEINLMTTTEPEVMKMVMGSKFARPRFTLALDTDFASNRIPDEPDGTFFEYIKRWLQDLVRQPALKSPSATDDIPFDLFVRMPQQFIWEQFKTHAFAAHKVLLKPHSDSPNGIHPRLPVAILIHGYPILTNPLDSFYTRMDFGTRESSTAICFGYHGVPDNEFDVIKFYQRGEEVRDAALLDRLEDLFND